MSTANSKLEDPEDAEKHVQAKQGRPLKRFFWWKLTKRQWIAALVASILAVLLVLLLILFLVVIPAIVQSHVNGVDMSINYVDIKTLSNDPNLSTFDVEFNIQVAYDASASSTLNNADATMLYGGKAFGEVEIAKQKFPKGKNSFPMVLQEVVKITDVDGFGAVSSALIREKSVSVDAHTKVKVHAMGLTFGGINLDRTFEIQSFNNFLEPKPVVNNITLSSCTSAGYEIMINVTLDNVSQVGIEGVGQLNLSVYNEQNYLGQAISQSDNVAFPRGNSSLALRVMIPSSNATKPALVGMVNSFLAGRGVRFAVTGDHPYATTAVLLKQAFATLNISMLYTDGLSKVTFSPKCDLTTLLAALA